jgi:hypothetical protein
LTSKTKSDRHPSQEELKEYFKYVDGQLIRIKESPSGPITLGKSFGGIASYGYIHGRFKNKIYLLHTLVWIYHNGPLASGVLDHINRDRADNRIENLRAATQQQNTFNRVGWKVAASRFKGVFKDRNKWKAGICIDRKMRHLGCFKTEIEADIAYREAAKLLHGDFRLE